MKTNLSLKFKVAKIVIGVAALAPIIGFALPTQAEEILAQGTNFCAKIDTSTTMLSALISEKEASYENGKAANLKALQASRAASDKALYNARVAANADYAAQFKALNEQATTSEQKAAVATFKKTTLKAVETRRANVDLAVERYRDGVDALLAARSSSYKSALSALKTSIDQSLKSPVKCGAAEDSFQEKLSNLTTTTETLIALASTRDEKITSADTKFNSAISAAVETLKAVLGQ